MKFLIDMNLTPKWRQLLLAEGWDSIHWSQVGHAAASDSAIMAYALQEGFIVFTNDLDFGALLALTRAGGPSVVQVRTQDVRPPYLAPLLIPVLQQYQSQLASGALLVVEEGQSRLRLLPIRP